MPLPAASIRLDSPMTTPVRRHVRRVRTVLLALAILLYSLSPDVRSESKEAPPKLIDLTDGPDALKDFAPRTVADIVNAQPATQATAPDGLPQVKIAIDGDVYPGSWRKLECRITTPGSAATASKITEVEWLQKAGPKTRIPETFFKNADLWLFLITPGNYAFTVRAKNEVGWSAPAEVRFAVMQGRPYLSERDGFQRVGSCERVVLPGKAWKQIAGPAAAIRPAENGIAIRPNDAGLYIFETLRLEEGQSERRGILVPAARDGKLGDRRPIANLPKTLTGFAGRTVIVDGSLSSDPDATDSLTARWSTPDSKRGASITAQPGLRAFFKAERPGSYTATVTISDGQLDSIPASVMIEIAPGDDGSDDPNRLSGDAQGPATKDLLLKRVSLAIWPPEPLADGSLIIPEDSGLQRAVELFSRRCDVALVVDPGLARPGHFHEFQLALEAGNTPLRHLLDSIARQTGTRYRRDGDRAFFLVKPGDSFRDEKMDSAAAGIDALHDKPDASDLLAPLRDYFQSSLARSGATMSFEANQQAIFAMLPKASALRLREIINVLREPLSNGLPIPEPATRAEENLRQSLGDKLVTKRGRFRVDRLLRDLARETGLAIAFDPKPFNGTLPYLKIDYENTPLRQVFRDIVDEAGFDGCSVEAPAGIWFYKGPRPFPTGEILWDSVEVRAYDLSSLFTILSPEAALFLSGETIAHQIRARIYPASWNDPGTCVFYHRGTQKLVVIHAPEAHRRIVDFLYDLGQRGHWAVGPLE